MRYEFGFIGSGHMGGALAGAACRSIGADKVIVSDIDHEKASALAQRLGCAWGDVRAVVNDSRYIFIGVKPQNIAELFDGLAPMLAAKKERCVLVSMAAGVTMEKIAGLSRLEHCPVIRIMPNTPVEVGEGCVLYTSNADTLIEETENFVANMSAAGGFVPMEEALIDAGCALSGCGPAFVYLFMDAMAKSGAACGIPAEKAMELAGRTVLGAAKLAISTGEDPLRLAELVATPGGSTIEGVRVLNGSAFYADVEKAVRASFMRTRELSDG